MPGAEPPNLRPALLMDVELTEGCPSIPAHDVLGREHREVQLLVRRDTRPLGVLRLPGLGRALSPQDVAAGVVEAGLLPDSADQARLLSGAPLPPADPAVDPDRLRHLAPSLTVAVCTRGRPEGLARLLLSMRKQTFGGSSVLVVDNAPVDDAVADAVRNVQASLNIRRVVEPRPGLSWARNAAIAACETEVLAFVDDDEVLDPTWTQALLTAFVAHPEAAAVTGLMYPAELDTQAQWWFEQYGGHSKGRGCTPAVLSPGTHREQSPLYPLPAFGAGGNMAFRLSALRQIGGFDTALGAGTETMGGEDTLALTEVMLAGGTVVYEPAVLVRHFHRRDDTELERQLTGYGRGLTAYYTSVVLGRPWLVPRLLRLLPRALRDLRSAAGPRLAGLPSDFPQDLLDLHRREMLRGPLAYVRARRRARVIARAAP